MEEDRGGGSYKLRALGGVTPIFSRLPLNTFEVAIPATLVITAVIFTCRCL